MSEYTKKLEKKFKEWLLEEGLKKGLEIFMSTIKAWIEKWKDKRAQKKIDKETKEVVIDKIEIPVKPRKITWVPSPHFSSRKGCEIDAVIIHHTGGTIKSALSWMQMKESKVSYHYLIDYEGNIYQMVKEEDKAWHAGISVLYGKEHVNRFSIGVAFEGSGTTKPPYTDAQYEAGAYLCKLLKKKYDKIVNGRIVGHKYVAPKRKKDPYQFDWHRFYELIGK